MHALYTFSLKSLNIVTTLIHTLQTCDAITGKITVLSNGQIKNWGKNKQRSLKAQRIRRQMTVYKDCVPW